MTVSPTFTTHVTLDLVAWNEAGLLELSPKFQRRPVWKTASKSYFIDTLLRGYPIPPIHVRLGISNEGKAVREIIDGQQRLRTVFDFVQNGFRLSRTLDGPWAGKRFRDLGPELADRLMMYKFHGFQYEGIDDSTVLEIFARINTYSVPLSKQELRNGKYFGVFKTEMYGAARRHLETWRSLRLFSETAIARMQEVEFVSELSVMLIDGMQDKKTTLDSFYGGLDGAWGDEPVQWMFRRQLRPAEYQSAGETMWGLSAVIETISEELGDVVADTVFSRPPMFYTLFGVIAHRNFGLPRLEIPTPKKVLSQAALSSLREAITELSELLDERIEDPNEVQSSALRNFLIASSRQTDNLGPRMTRFETLWTRAGLAD